MWLAGEVWLFSGMQLARHAGEGGRGEQAPLLPFSWGSRGSKSALLNAMICFLIVNMTQRRSYKLKASNI